MSNRVLSFSCVLAMALIVPPAASADPSGGAVAPGPPRVSSVACKSQTGTPCRGRGLVRGQQLVIRGRNLASADKVAFLGRRGRRDDVLARAERSTPRAVVATVPQRARSGGLALVREPAEELELDQRVTVRDAPPIDATPGTRFFFDGRRRPSLTFEVAQATTAQVELLDAAGAVVRAWSLPAEPGTSATVRWDGRTTQGVAAPGSYTFRLVEASSSGARPTSSAGEFFFADHLFPIRGPHNLGYTDTNDFGGPRDHKGQDMFARCGTPVVAARGGRVQYAGYQAAAGNYVVIDGAGTGQDYVYMHMLEAPLVRTGQRVFTGQQIGEIGETGRATGCHLHFELWTAPGWYEGGEAVDPLPAAKRWDSYS